MSQDNAVVGKRISFGFDRGTVRYHGPVPPAKGDWLGIEWDDPSRGKHDGISADGTRYFQVRVSGSGSFVRPTSSKLSHGCSFLQALQSKYLADEQAPIPPEANQAKYSRKNLAEIEIETPNMQGVVQRASRLDRLREVGLGGSKANPDTGDEQDITLEVAYAFDERAGETVGSIRATCPNLRWLELSRSLLPDWHQVSLITAELDKLQTLLLHFTRLSLPPDPLPAIWSERFASIQDLRLDGTLMTWPDIVRLASAFDNLRNLQLGSNQIARLSLVEVKGTLLPSLTSLSLEDNLLDSWTDIVAALSHLPALESLNLTKNRINDVPPATSTSPKLSSLIEVYLAENKIESWSSLEGIDTWIGDKSAQRGLERLHITAAEIDRPAPLLSRYEYRDFRAIAIARLPHLRVLDHTAITAKERSDAELFVYSRFKDADPTILFGRNHGHDSSKPFATTWQEKVANFPRLSQLAERFDGLASGPLRDETQDTDAQNTKGTLRSKMITLRVYKSNMSPSGHPPYLPSDVKVQQLSILASTPFRLARIKLAKAASIRSNQITSIWVMLKEHRTTADGTGATATTNVNSNDGEGRQEESHIVLEIDDLSRDLDWYEVGQGDALVLVTADDT